MKWFVVFVVSQNKVSKSRTPTSQPSKSTPRAQKISPSKGNSRSPQTPSPSKTGQSQGRGRAQAGTSATPPGRGAGSQARRGLGLGSPTSSASPAKEAASLLWVDKYRPLSLKAVIGQQGEQSCANKLVRWLQNWHRHHAGGGAKPPGVWVWWGGGAGRKDLHQPNVPQVPPAVYSL